MPKNKPITLLLTATISPPQNCPDLKRADPIVRLKDYCDALKFYLSVSDDYINKIIFVENTGSDLSELKKIVAEENSNKEVEFLEYRNGNDFPPEYGKGYGEMLILNYALDNSKLISENDFVWKATGRLVLSNIRKIIDSTPLDAEIYCDLHDSFRIFSLEYFFDPRFYAFTKKMYDKCFRLSEVELRGAHIEHKYFHILKGLQGQEGVYLRFKSQPWIKGHAGSAGNNYASTKKNVQRIAQQLFRVLVPSIWL